MVISSDLKFWFFLHRHWLECTRRGTGGIRRPLRTSAISSMALSLVFIEHWRLLVILFYRASTGIHELFTSLFFLIEHFDYAPALNVTLTPCICDLYDEKVLTPYVVSFPVLSFSIVYVLCCSQTHFIRRSSRTIFNNTYLGIILLWLLVHFGDLPCCLCFRALRIF